MNQYRRKNYGVRRFMGAVILVLALVTLATRGCKSSTAEPAAYPPVPTTWASR